MTDCEILSIQSHVVHGYCGNRSVVLALQLLGYEVDQINTVHLSNHTQYAAVEGQVLNAGQLEEVFTGLKLNNLCSNYSYLLTGYFGDSTMLRKVSSVVRELKELSPKMLYVCDPVMGDNGFMYVPKELLPIYRQEIVGLADVILPNQYEARLLTDVEISSVETAWKAVDVLHKAGPRIVVLTSTSLSDSPDTLLCLASIVGEMADGKAGRFGIKIPRMPGSFVGTGDLFSSLFIAHLHRAGVNSAGLKEALEKAQSTIHCVLKRTVEHAVKLCGDATLETATVGQLELRLVQSVDDIRQGCRIFEAEQLP